MRKVSPNQQRAIDTAQTLDWFTAYQLKATNPAVRHHLQTCRLLRIAGWFESRPSPWHSTGPADQRYQYRLKEEHLDKTLSAGTIRSAAQELASERERAAASQEARDIRATKFIR